jgi:hypothetical protein
MCPGIHSAFLAEKCRLSVIKIPLVRGWPDSMDLIENAAPNSVLEQAMRRICPAHVNLSTFHLCTKETT